METTATETIVSTMRRLRIQAGYTQEDVSRLLNIRRATYCNYENGKRTPPLEVIIALAELYHVSADYLLRGVDALPCTGPMSRELLTEFDSLSAASQREVLVFVHFKKELSHTHTGRARLRTSSERKRN